MSPEPALAEELQRSLDLLLQKLPLTPGDPTLHNALGIILAARGDAGMALEAFDHAITLAPTYAEALDNKGHVLEILGRPEDALAAFTAAAALTPHYADAEARIDDLSAVMGRALPPSPWRASWRGKFKAMFTSPSRVSVHKGMSESALRETLARHPGDVDNAMALGVLLKEQGRHVEAQHFLRYVLELEPGRGAAVVALAESFEACDQREHANAILTAHQHAAMGDDRLFPRLLRYRSELCDWHGYAEIHAKATEVVQRTPGAIDPFTVWTQWDDPILHAANGKAFLASRTAGVAPVALEVNQPSDRVTVGYISADFHQNASASLWSELFELHDRAQFRVLGYALWADDRSPRRQRLTAAFDQMTSFWGVSDAAAVRKIVADRVDILVDLTGVLRNSRPRLLAHRPAPILVSYPGATGAQYIDYAIVDHVVAPPDHDQLYTEKFVRLPHTYQINDRKRPRPRPLSRQAYGLPEKGAVFSSFSTSTKITPSVFSCWMEILRAVPDSVLWLRGWKTAVENNLRDAAVRHGIDPARLIFAGNSSYGDHLARYGVVDLALDTLTLGGHTTVSDALWMGCPVVTATGKSYMARVGISLLRAAGLSELVMESPEAYVACAISLARSPDALINLRRKLEAARARCALFDSPAITRQLEWAYRRMRDLHVAGEAPQAFDVPGDLR